VPSDRTRGNRHKLKHSKFQLNTRKNFFAQRGCGFSFSGDIQNPPGQGPVQSALGDPALTGELD